MALTRPKYSQIYDTDHKNSARAATTENVTLTGAAPNTVDGVTLAIKDRVLVKNQANAAQNGIYYVTVVGTGSNGTWTRSLDADSNIKLTSGTTLSVEEGNFNAGKSFRLTTTPPIILNSTLLTWTDASGGGGGASGNNGQIQFNDTNSFGGALYLYYNEVTGTMTANAGVASTNTTTGTFIVTGGVGVSGALNVGANVTVTGNVLPSANVTYNLGSPTQRWKDLYLSGNTINLNGATISATDGAVTFQNSLGGSFSVTGAASGQSTGTFGNLVANSGIASTSTSTGALTVTGGAGVSGTVNIGGAISIAGTANITGNTNITGSLAVSGDATVTGNLTVNGTTTNINTTNLIVEDKNMVLADVATPTDSTADGAGITVKGTTDKTFTWADATDAWTSSEDLNLLTGKQYKIDNNSVLTATTLGSGVVNSSLTSLGTVISLAATTAVSTNLSSGNIFATGSTSGTWSTANVSLYESVTASTTNATYYPMLSDKTAGNTGSFTATTLTHNPSTGNLTVTGVVGNHWGPVAATTANVSSTLAVTGTSTFTGATNHAGGITASTVSAGTIGNSGATLTGTLSTAAQTNVTSVGTLTGLSVSGTTGLSITDSTGSASAIKILSLTNGNRNLALIPNIGSGSYNGLSTAGDSGIVATGSSLGNASLVLTTWASATTGIRIASVSNVTTITLAGTTSATGNIVPSANLTYNLGSTTAWWNSVYGVSVQAKYADLAEHYEGDQTYDAGTVVVFGGDKEITVTTQDHDPRVAGVISTNPAYLMNAANPGLPVALQGRVPCRVQGPVNKGDVLVTSTTPGVAQKIDNAKFLPGCVVGKALVSINTNNIETIEVVVGRF